MDVARTPPEIALFCVPYDSGHLRRRMGAGPDHLLACGLVERLREIGWQVETRTATLTDNTFVAEGSAAFELARQLSDCVRGARERGAWPLILSGNCGTAAMGAIAGVADPEIGIVWFDAHADFNTPETTASGFLDGMALTIVTGGCWRAMAESVAGFKAVAQERVVLVAARDVDPAEAKRLSQSEITVVPGSGEVFTAALEALAARAREVYLHIDLDVIDPAEGRANSYASPGGLRVAEVLQAIEVISHRFRISAAALTSYDPAEDCDGRIAEAAMKIAVALATGAARAKANGVE